jgi:hypothetical protein
MHETLFILFMLNPIVSKNPVVQDTVAVTNIHFTSGLRAGGDMLKPGPEFGIKFEYLLAHPVIVRVSADFNTAYANNIRFPQGRKKSIDLSFETLAYRGRKEFSVYLGLGAVLALNSFDLKRQMSDSLFPSNFAISPSEIYETEIDNAYGYRIILGMRYRVHYSFEFGFQEMKPQFTFRGRDSIGTFTMYRPSQMSSLRFTLGYLFHP